MLVTTFVGFYLASPLGVDVGLLVFDRPQQLVDRTDDLKAGLQVNS